MRFLILAILLTAVALSGCSVERVYTFQKDRVDQSVEGNRGYLVGTPPPATATEPSKRTLIGVDIEVGLFPGEKSRGAAAGAVTAAEGDVVEERGMMKEESVPQKKETTRAPEEDREEWIK